jgi:hypothetical protein
MSDEKKVISISSGSVASQHVDDVAEGFYVQHEHVEVKVEPGLSSSSPTFCPERLIHVNDLNGLLSAHPCTKCTQTKKNRDGTKKYEYWKCCCGCSYRITLTYEGDMIHIKESSLPASHDSSSDQKPPTSLRMTDEVHCWLDYLAHCHLFDPNYGAKKESLFLFYDYKTVH